MATWNSNLQEWEFSKGEDAWFVSGYADNGLIIIKVKILKVDYTQRELWKELGSLKYWVDEPGDYPIEIEDLFPDKDSALWELEQRVELNNECVRGEIRDGIGENDETLCEYEPTLSNHRYEVHRDTAKFWRQQSLYNVVAKKEYPRKEKWIDWFPPITMPERDE